MAQQGAKVAKPEEGYAVLADIGGGIVVAMVDPRILREQDINARIMDKPMFQQLVANIKKGGKLESLPFCALTKRGIEIISGHHRVKAAMEAGLKQIPVLLNTQMLTPSQIAAKQLAHNAISGFDDKDVLREIAKKITEVEDMLETALGEDVFKAIEASLDSVISPRLSFDWKLVTFSFLPHQLSDFKKLIEKSVSADFHGLAEIDAFKPFVEALEKTQKFQDVKAVGTAVYAMVRAALKELEGAGYTDELQTEWVPVSKIIGGAAIPEKSAEVIRGAVDTMIKNGKITSKNRWEALEIMASAYVDGDLEKRRTA